ncbi:phosphotransferase [Streptomyces sp. NPDC059917]|uniref:phosphotransferase n=1 Tax=Streptomyces sp. NPDC059917 TaxID=3347002 RepID=UPI0036606382
MHRYVKVSPSERFFIRESRAYRHIAPALGHSRAPHLLDSRAQDLALLLTAAPGAPVKEAGRGGVAWREVHREAGALCARLHEAGGLDPTDRAEEEASLRTVADGAEKYLARAGDRLTAGEQRLIRDHADRLCRIGPVPLGYIHGDNQPRNWLWSEVGLALVDFERSRPAARVQDRASAVPVSQAVRRSSRSRLFRGDAPDATHPRIRRQEGPLDLDLDAVMCAGVVSELREDRRLYVPKGRAGGQRDLAACAARVISDERVGPRIVPGQQ